MPDSVLIPKAKSNNIITRYLHSTKSLSDINNKCVHSVSPSIKILLNNHIFTGNALALKKLSLLLRKLELLMLPSGVVLKLLAWVGVEVLLGVDDVTWLAPPFPIPWDKTSLSFQSTSPKSLMSSRSRSGQFIWFRRSRTKCTYVIYNNQILGML